MALAVFKRFDSLDSFLAMMVVLSLVAGFFLLDSWGDLRDLRDTVSRSDALLAEIRDGARRVEELEADPIASTERREPPTTDFFSIDVPNFLSGRRVTPTSTRATGTETHSDDWMARTWQVEWDEISRENLAYYIREVESRRRDVRAARLEMRNIDPPDPYRKKYDTTVIFEFFERIEE